MNVTLILHSTEGQLQNQLPRGLRTKLLGGRRTLTDIPRLARFLATEKPDALLSNLDHNNIAALLAKQLSLSKTALIMCQHNPITSDFVTSESWTHRLVPQAYRQLSSLADRAVAVSSGIADELVACAGIPASKVHVIHNPVIGPDFDRRCTEPVSHPWLENRESATFATAGRLVAQKDHDTLLRALALHRRNHNSRLLLLGDGPLREKLESMAVALGIRQSVDFLGFQENPLPYLRDADAFVLSSKAEGFGNVLVEAMGCGTPVISTNCRHGPAEILSGGKYGILVPSQDPLALSRAMDEVRTLRDRFPADALLERAASFSEDICIERYHQIILSSIQASHSA